MQRSRRSFSIVFNKLPKSIWTLSIIFLSYSYTVAWRASSRKRSRAHAVLHPEFLRKTKTPQNDSGTIIAWHTVNLNPSLHVYQHSKTEIRRAKLIYTARTIVERGILPTVSKTHFTPLEKKKNPRKKSSVVGEQKQTSRFSPLIPEAEEPGCGTGPWTAEKTANFYARKLSGGRFCLFQQVPKKKKKLALSNESLAAGEDSARPFLRSPKLSATDPSRFERLSRLLNRDSAARQQLCASAVSAHGLWANWCSISIHTTGDLLRVISMTSSSVHGLLDQLLWRGRHFAQSGYCGIVKRCVKGIQTFTSLKRITAARYRFK